MDKNQLNMNKDIISSAYRKHLRRSDYLYKHNDYFSLEYIGYDEKIIKEIYDMERAIFITLRNLDYPSYKRNMLNSRQGIALLYKPSNKTIAYIIFESIDDKSCFLNSIAVNERFRRKKLGTFLISIAVELIKREGFDFIILTVPENSNAKSFFEKNDFIIARKENMQKTYYDSILKMIKLLKDQSIEEGINIKINLGLVKEGVLEMMYGGVVDGIIMVRNLTDKRE